VISTLSFFPVHLTVCQAYVILQAKKPPYSVSVHYTKESVGGFEQKLWGGSRLRCSAPQTTTPVTALSRDTAGSAAASLQIMALVRGVHVQVSELSALPK